MLKRLWRKVVEMKSDIVVVDGVEYPVVGPPEEIKAESLHDTVIGRWHELRDVFVRISASQIYPYGRPRVIDERGAGHPTLSTLYGSNGPGTLLLETDFDTLRSFYNFELNFAHGYNRAGNGQRFYGIGALRVKAGPSLLQPEMWIDAGGAKRTDPETLMFNTWPDAEPEMPNPNAIDPKYGPDVETNFTGRGVAGFTSGGDIGWGVGGGSHIGPDGGAFTVWCSSDPGRSPNVGSDAIHKIGWFDDHIIPNPIFWSMVKGDGNGGQPPTEGDYHLEIVVDGVAVGKIPILAPNGETDLIRLKKGDVVLGKILWESV